MAAIPDPNLELTTMKGVTRTLDDWTTSFHLALVVLPGRPEAAAYVRIGRRIAQTLGGSDCRPGFLVTGSERNALRVLGDAGDTHLVFLDAEGTAVKGLGVSVLPAFVHVRNDNSLASCVGGWDPPEWNAAVGRLAKEMAWSKPLIPAPGDPPPFPGWNA